MSLLSFSPLLFIVKFCQAPHKRDKAAHSDSRADLHIKAATIELGGSSSWIEHQMVVKIALHRT
jgi:hypothetical protein